MVTYVPHERGYQNSRHMGRRGKITVTRTEVRSSLAQKRSIRELQRRTDDFRHGDSEQLRRK